MLATLRARLSACLPHSCCAAAGDDGRSPHQQHDRVSRTPAPRSQPGCRHLPHTCPFLDALAPVQSVFHPFLADADAARLLRTSRTAALALLPGYTFTRHIFQPSDVDSLRRLRDVSLTYRFRVTLLALPRDAGNLTFDFAPPHLSPIPSSVTALSFGPLDAHFPAWSERRWAAFCAVADDWQERPPWRLPPTDAAMHESGAEERMLKAEWLARWAAEPVIIWDMLQPWQVARSDATCPLPPGLLPQGLRVLRFSCDFNMPLWPGSLPSTLTYLQLPNSYSELLPPGVLPDSLLHLTVGEHRRQLLVPGSLPASLERLCVDVSSPLIVDLSSTRLKALDVRGSDVELPPHSLPATLLRLSLNRFNAPLLLHALPSALVELRLGDLYNHPLPPGVLPPSLRALKLGPHFARPLQLGSLPEGLLFLRFVPWSWGSYAEKSYGPTLLPGVLPSTLLGLDLSNRYAKPLPLGVIPSGVRWVRLDGSRYRGEQELGKRVILPPQAELVWYDS